MIPSTTGLNCSSYKFTCNVRYDTYNPNTISVVQLTFDICEGDFKLPVLLKN